MPSPFDFRVLQCNELVSVHLVVVVFLVLGVDSGFGDQVLGHRRRPVYN